MSARVLAILLLAAPLGACGGFRVEEVPDRPIAFVRAQVSDGLISIDDFRQALRMANFDDPRTLKRRRTTRVALITVPTREVRTIHEISEGALPLDWTLDGNELLIGERARGRSSLALSVWNRHTGAFDRVRPSESIGLAAMGRGKIRLVTIGMTLHGSRPGVLLHVRGVGPQPVVGGENGNEPDLSPDGRHVVFTRMPRRASRDPMMFIASLGEKDLKPLGRGRQPRFSGDGRWIVFSREKDGSRDIWMRRPVRGLWLGAGQPTGPEPALRDPRPGPVRDPAHSLRPERAPHLVGAPC
ncbi:MAG: PD40 domain-containing protein [Deltaproteobacteria bacterium]|nr:PD40 domain-containing protein [Deltaproteobacteria bacterium]